MYLMPVLRISLNGTIVAELRSGDVESWHNRSSEVLRSRRKPSVGEEERKAGLHNRHTRAVRAAVISRINGLGVGVSGSDTSDPFSFTVIDDEMSGVFARYSLCESDVLLIQVLDG